MTTLQDYSRHLHDPQNAAEIGSEEVWWLDALQSDYAVEAWQGNIATGRFELGPLARRIHGIADDRPCGLGPILGAYDSASCARVADVFCDTVCNGGQFSYVARVKAQNACTRLVLAAGETRLSADGRTGQIRGVFLLPRLATGLAAV